MVFLRSWWYFSSWAFAPTLSLTCDTQTCVLLLEQVYLGGVQNLRYLKVSQCFWQQSCNWECSSEINGAAELAHLYNCSDEPFLRSVLNLRRLMTNWECAMKCYGGTEAKTHCQLLGATHRRTVRNLKLSSFLGEQLKAISWEFNSVRSNWPWSIAPINAFRVSTPLACHLKITCFVEGFYQDDC